MPEDNIIFLKRVRISYPCLYEPKQYDGDGKYNYSAAFHVENGSPNDVLLRATIARVANAQWGKSTPVILPTIEGRTQTFCYINGLIKGHEGVWILTAKRGKKDGPPSVLNKDAKTPILAEQGIVYGGCYVDAKVSIYAQTGKNGNGMRATLIGVKFVCDGESFGGAPPVSTTGFEAEEESTEGLF